MTEIKGLIGIGRWINIIVPLKKPARYSEFHGNATTNGECGISERQVTNTIRPGISPI
jgi:hypothetical protein